MDRFQSADGGGLSYQTAIIAIRPGRQVVLLRITKNVRKKEDCIENKTLLYRSFCLRYHQGPSLQAQKCRQLGGALGEESETTGTGSAENIQYLIFLSRLNPTQQTIQAPIYPAAQIIFKKHLGLLVQTTKLFCNSNYYTVQCH